MQNTDKIRRQVNCGNVVIGGGARVKIQSMCTTRTSDTRATLAQIAALKEAGCDIVRVSVLDEKDADAIGELKKGGLPVVADIHFSYKLAVRAIENGCDKVRINPCNIGGEREIAIVADCIKAHKIPVRVGANTGSIEKQFLEKYSRSKEALVESALCNASILEKHGVSDVERGARLTTFRRDRRHTPHLHNGRPRKGNSCGKAPSPRRRA